MGKLKRAILLSFRTKIIVPVVAVMVLLMAVSMWLVNRRVTSQLRADVARQLSTADAVLKNLQDSHANSLFARYRNVANVARLKAIATLFDQEQGAQSEEGKRTLYPLLSELIKEDETDAITLASDEGLRLTATRDPRFNVAEFENACATSIAQAIKSGQPRADAVRAGDRLFDIVSIPIFVENAVVAAATFSVENTVTKEFKQLTESELVLLVDGQFAATTLRKTDLQQLLSSLPALNGSGAPGKPYEEFILNDEHYSALRGTLSAPGDPHLLSYLMLSSYEKPMQALRVTQQLILLVSSAAILLGAAIVWFLVRKVTEPLEELRDSVEALGQGDLSRRIEVSSMDECGELALVFNQMAENIKNSREQLEATVETLKTTQAQLIQSEKLSGIGEFVAGVAHELNNPLTSVMGFSELLQQADVNPQHKLHLGMIYKSAVRCQKIVQSLLSFARRHQPERKLVCVNSLVGAAAEILHYQMRTSNIEVSTHLDPRLPLAMVDPHQFQQVFLNIINNARQAIEAHRPDGWVRVTTDTCGTNIRVTFHDNGPGIPEANLSKVFDPFFTTKEIGKGTGLGLSLCYGIVKEHGGTIKVRSKYGEGTTFIIELPIAAGATEALEQTNAPYAALANPLEGAGKKVLVIDDEESILQMVREALGQSGYDVDVASDGESALRHLQKGSYDLALCDLKMPGLNGQQVYERVRATNPKLSERMIFITGDVVNERTRAFLRERNKVCLTKPFSLAEFRNAITKALAMS